MNTRLTFLILLVLTTLTSCDYGQRVTGTVLDSKTNLPIVNADVKKRFSETDSTATKHTGEFELKSVAGGLFKCPPMTVIVSKEGYSEQAVRIQNEAHRIIKLQKETK